MLNNRSIMFIRQAKFSNWIRIGLKIIRPLGSNPLFVEIFPRKKWRLETEHGATARLFVNAMEDLNHNYVCHR